MFDRSMEAGASQIALGAASLAVAGLIFAGCNAQHAPPPEQTADYSVTINKYYEGRPLCLFPDTVVFPVTDASPEKAEQLGLQALASAGLLEAKPGTKGTEKGTATYELTPAGQAAMMPDIFKKGAGNFCYGHRKVASIDSAKRNSSTTELVNYHYGVPQPAAWASAPAIDETFPHIATEIAGQHLGQATLLDTDNGWEISGEPATIVPTAPAPKKPSELARAKNLLHRFKK